MGTEKPRFSITVSESMYEKINQYHHENRFSTQTKAISSLIQIGLDSVQRKLSESERKISSSEDEETGIVKELVSLFKSFNDEGQSKLLDYAHDLDASGNYKKDSSSGVDQKRA